MFETPQCTNLSEVTAEQNVAGPSNVLFKTREDNVRKPLSPVTETIDTASKTENVNKRYVLFSELCNILFHNMIGAVFLVLRVKP